MPHACTNVVYACLQAKFQPTVYLISHSLIKLVNNGSTMMRQLSEICFWQYTDYWYACHWHVTNKRLYVQIKLPFYRDSTEITVASEMFWKVGGSFLLVFPLTIFPNVWMVWHTHTHLWMVWLVLWNIARLNMQHMHRLKIPHHLLRHYTVCTHFGSCCNIMTSISLASCYFHYFV